MKPESNGHRGTALIYCRVSTKSQEQEGTSLDSQAAACVKHAEALGYTVGRVTQEVYSGAELWDRPLLARDRADLKTGQFQALIAYSTDRLARNPTHLAIIAEECERAGVDLIFVTEPLDASPEGALIRYVKGYAAAVEREKFKERSLRGRLMRVHSGKIPNAGFELYGYRRNKETGIRVPYEPEAAIVRTIFQSVAEGVPIREVVRRLTNDAIPAPSIGKVDHSNRDRPPRWGTGQIQRLLRRSDYKGEAYYWRWSTADGNGQKEMRPPSEWVQLPESASPALVSPEVWDIVQDRLAKNRGDRARNQKHAYLLRGLIYCAVCHQRMHARQQHRNYTAYVCSSHGRGHTSCGSSQVHLIQVEAWAWDQVAAILKNPEIIAAELERRRNNEPDQTLTSDLEVAKAALAKIERKQERLISLYAAGDDGFTLDMVKEQLAGAEREKAQWQETVAGIEARLASEQLVLDRLDAVTTYCIRVAANLETFSFEEKRLAVEALGIRVYASGRDWEIRGSIPLQESAVILSPPRSPWGSRTGR